MAITKTDTSPARYTALDAFAELVEPGVDAYFTQLSEQGKQLIQAYVDVKDDAIRGPAAREQVRLMIRDHRLSGLFDVKPTPPRPEST